MHSLLGCDDIPSKSFCCTEVAMDKNEDFWVFWQILVFLMMQS